MKANMADLIKEKNRDQSGMVLILTLLIMAVMSIIGVAAMTTSRIDIQVSHNTKVARQAFYMADSGIEMSPKIIRRIIDEGAAPNIPNLSLHNNLMNEIMGYATESSAIDAVYPEIINPDLALTMGDVSVAADIDRTGKGFMSGSGVEFASGAEGAGVGATGGVMIFYTLDSVGQAPRSARSRVDAYYRYVVGAAGGK